MNKLRIQSIVLAVTLGLSLAAMSASAQTTSTNNFLPGNGDPNAIVCYALAGVLPCGGSRSAGSTTTNGATTATTTTTTGPYGTTTTNTTQTTTTSSGGSGSFLGRFFGVSSSSTRDLSANVSQGFLGKTQKNLAVVLVKSPDRPEVYRLIGGKKLLIPNDKVFLSYGYSIYDIVILSQSQIDLYPRIKLIKFEGDVDVYYLTEGGLTRKVINEAVFNSYADRDQDAVVINRVEFSLYPENQYIYNESTQVVGRKPNVYLLGNGTKKIVFPDELARENISDAMIAPVNQIEFDSYQILLPEAPKQRVWYNIF